MTDQIFDSIETSEINSAGSLVLAPTLGTVIKTDSKRVVKFEGRVTDGTPGEAPKFEIHTTRGSIAEPEVLEPGDFASQLRFTTYFNNGSEDDGKSLVVLGTQVDLSADKEDMAPASNFFVILSAGDGTGSLPDGNYHAFTFSNTGSFNTQAVKLETANVSTVATEPGTMVYNKETDKFQGYVNDAGNGEPGWINLH